MKINKWDNLKLGDIIRVDKIISSHPDEVISALEKGYRIGRVMDWHSKGVVAIELFGGSLVGYDLLENGKQFGGMYLRVGEGAEFTHMQEEVEPPIEGLNIPRKFRIG
jgi:hypothetical protein